MIVSASYRTDIPAFFSGWFLQRLKRGCCRVGNPYSSQTYTVSLKPQDVDAIVFWTKNLAPLWPHLADIKKQGFTFTVQYSITGYPPALEPRVPAVEHSIKCFKVVASQFGPWAAVWRYDPILFTSLTDADFHLRHFAALARELKGATNQVVISWAHIYKKTRRGLDTAGRMHGFSWWDPGWDEKRDLAQRLAQIAEDHGMQAAACGQPELEGGAIGRASCIDAGRLSRLAGRIINAPTKGHRPQCGCFGSRDIGSYDTCGHGCAFCYAVNNPGGA